MQLVPSPSWRRRSACSHAWEHTYQANWSLVSPRQEYKPPTGPRTSDDQTWSNGWAATGTHLDMIAKQYKKEARTGAERGKKGVWNGVETGAKMGFKWHKKQNLARFDNLKRRGTAVLCRSTSFQPFFAVPPLFSPVFDDFRQKWEKRSLENGGTGKERKVFFPVSFPFLFFPFPF